MHNQIKTIDHSEIFSSEDSFLNFFKPIPAGDSPQGPVGQCKSFQLPIWNPLRRLLGLIVEAEINNGKARLIFAFPVSAQYDLQTSLERNYLQYEEFVSSLEEISKYFVNGTIIGDVGGASLIVNGPKEFTWTFREPEGNCVSCGEEICDDDAKSDH